MKKYFNKLLAWLLLSSLALSLYGCDEGEHVHSWGEWEVVKVATCGTSGYSIRTCEVCGEEDRSVQYSTPHEYSSVYNFDATYHWRDAICQHAGEVIDRERHTFKDGNCTVCGARQGTAVSQGLQYRGILGKNVYKVIGIGTTLDSYVVIARYYNSCEIIAVGDGAFEATEGLEGVTMQEFITEIGERAFADCKELKSVRFTNKVEKLGASMLSGCTALETVYFDGTLAEFNEIRANNPLWSEGAGVFTVVCTDTSFVENGGAGDPTSKDPSVDTEMGE